ncbi:MAG: glycosyltransferase family 32 protein [Flammeovirgaceae bacterium]
MPIPKVIYQTYINDRLPIITRFFIWWMKRQNSGYRYEFYDDTRIEEFLKHEFPPEVFQAYNKLAIGAAKADFFRYAILYKHGGVYVDIDGAILRPLSEIIRPDDVAVLSREVHPGLFVQWALIYDKGHPFMERTLRKCIDNINENRSPNNVLYMTGPNVYSEVINLALAAREKIPHRIYGVDFERKSKPVIIPKHFLNYLLYLKRPSWDKVQKTNSVLKTN